ncbi:MAG TPA: LysR substrate-binding domain-containing protein [Solirubrobacteraceae bacterium]|jgi:DNA-binding transcriptional LysR family regulator|nr:LysR substrate-binding domain-containing protein [Solirubrobacteraceae bacterium]
MLSVSRLRILREVALRGSFSAAAEALSYTQSAVSQQIAALEAETGVALLERRPRGVRLTGAGQTLLEHAEGILARLEAAEEELAAIAGLRGGQLRMASFPTAGATLMPVAIARFRASYPEVELTLAEGEPEEIAPRLHAGEFDLALLFEFGGAEQTPTKDQRRGGTEQTSTKDQRGRGREQTPAKDQRRGGPGTTQNASPNPAQRWGTSLKRVELLEDPMYLALPLGHRLADKRALRLEDLHREAWVQTSRSSPCARHVVRCCHTAGFEPKVAFESDDYQTVQGLVAAGVGVALIPELALAPHPTAREDVVVRALSPSPPVRSVIAALPGRVGAHMRLTPAASAMLRILEEAAAARHRPLGTKHAAA